MPGCPAVPHPAVYLGLSEFFGWILGYFFGVLVKWIYGKLKSDKQRRFYTIIISGLIFILINWNSYQALYEFLPIAGLVRVFFGIGFLFGFVIGVFKPEFELFIDP